MQDFDEDDINYLILQGYEHGKEEMKNY
jgi:hypothetical protein